MKKYIQPLIVGLCSLLIVIFIFAFDYCSRNEIQSNSNQSEQSFESKKDSLIEYIQSKGISIEKESPGHYQIKGEAAAIELIINDKITLSAEVSKTYEKNEEEVSIKVQYQVIVEASVDKEYLVLLIKDFAASLKK